MKRTYIVKKDQHRHITIDGSGHYTIKLTGEGGRVDISGNFWLKDKETLDLNITIVHQAPQTSSTTTLKVVAQDRSAAHLNGTIIVKPSAYLTDSFLAQKVLLLSNNAQAHVIPNLEISNHDVKCSHAATVSTVDPEQIFYLRSRGLSSTKARSIIANGFLEP